MTAALCILFAIILVCWDCLRSSSGSFDEGEE